MIRDAKSFNGSFNMHNANPQFFLLTKGSRIDDFGMHGLNSETIKFNKFGDELERDHNLLYAHIKSS